MSHKRISKVEIDKGVCISCSMCSFNTPDAFKSSEKENTSIVREGAEKLDADTLLETAQSCPVSAIVLYDETGQRVFP